MNTLLIAVNFSEFLGKLHPLVVHLPIGLLPLAALFYWLGKRESYAFLNSAIPITLLASFLTAFAAIVFGFLLAKEGGYDGNTLFWHKWLGIGVGVISLAGWWLTRRGTPQNGNTSALVLGLGLLLITLTGHFGGSLTHGEDYLTAPFKSDRNIKETALPEQVDSIGVYAHLVQPILAEKCYACHNDKKQNGGLNLTSWEKIQEGGDGGAVINPEAWESELLERVTLPQERKKFMPPKGVPMTFGEVSLLKWWLEQGANPDVKLTALELNDEIINLMIREYKVDPSPKPFVERVKVEPLPEENWKALESAGFVINYLGEANFLLDVNLDKEKSEEFDLQSLLKAKDHITWLNLKSANISDEDLKIIGQLSNLSRLRLEYNDITDQGLPYLNALENLESINLIGNKITDDGLESLGQLSGLKRAFLWKTEVSPEAAAQLKSTKEDLELNIGL